MHSRGARIWDELRAHEPDRAAEVPLEPVSALSPLARRIRAMIERALEQGVLKAERAGARLRNPAVAALLAVAALILIGALARILLNRRVQAPWIQPDEQQYSDLAKT
jgi:hypothetical protein